jgi:amidase
MWRLLCAVLGLLILAGPVHADEFAELDIAELQLRMQRGELNAEQLVTWYLDRIDAIDRNGPQLNSIIELNPDALTIARALDEERQASGPRSAMHGIPVVLKANIDTGDQMHTTAGSLALKDHKARTDAFLVSRLRDAGAVILGKANLSEWANFRSTDSSSGWSSLGGQTRNPYSRSRNPCGSSSGSAVAVAANLATVAVGTETDGSIVCPAGINGVVGIKPSLGLISQSGIIPIAHSQDTAGPIGRSVRDAAILLAAMTGTDNSDPGNAGMPQPPSSFVDNLSAEALKGKRIGIVRSFHGAGSDRRVERILRSSIKAMKRAGATIIDDIDIDFEGVSAAEGVVLMYEFKAGLARYLQSSGAPYRTLEDIIAFNEMNADTVMPIFGQERMLASNASGELSDPEYLEALALSKDLSRGAIDGVMQEYDLDVLVAPTNGPAWLTDHKNGDAYHIGSSSYAAVSGYPNVTVPAGFVTGLPVGLSFIGSMNSDKTVIEIAYAFEQATRVRKPPKL